MSETLAPLYLKKNEERRLRAGHLWVFSNEIDTGRSPLGGYSAGQLVELRDYRDKPLGTGYINPHTLIAARLVSRDPDYRLDKSLIVHRLKVALSLRERRYPDPFYRLLFGESDGLPGLVLDRFGDYLVAQVTTAGMEAQTEALVAAIEQVLKPKALLLRNDVKARELEGLPLEVTSALGDFPAELEVIENGCRFLVTPSEGQKTGWFYDHRDNRARLAPWVQGKRVLDLFSYVGGWGIQAAVAGAEHVQLVDASLPALELAERNAVLNGVGDKVDAIQGDVFQALRELREARAQFDVVIADPPAFIKRKRDHKEGLGAYRRVNQMAIQVLARDGILVSASCSSHLAANELREQVLGAARHLDRSALLIEQGHQACDHPIHPAIPETEYIKSLTFRILPA